ncbi:MAG: efflux RND transporter permease subunit, partial [Balneolaceae bacterium]
MNELFRRKYLISMFYLAVVAVGVMVWQRIPVEMSPDMQLPSVTVSYLWSRTSPEVVEQEITRRVEQQVRRLRDVERVTSVSNEGRSSVTVYFHKHAPVDFRSVELQEYLRVLEESLPPSVQPGRVSHRVPQELQGMQTFLVYSINSRERMPSELLDFTRRNIKLPMLGIRGIAGVELEGVRDQALLIDFDVPAAERLGISTTGAMRQVNERLSWRSAGYREHGGQRYSLMVPPMFGNTSDITAMPVSLPGSERQILLGDIAQVRVGDYPERTARRINGNPALTIRFERETGVDALDLAETVIARMDEIAATLPPDIHLQIERDATEELREELAALERQALISLFAVFLVLLLFIRKVRAPLVILGSILFSLLFSVIMLHIMGYTINVITLAGLTIALGMIIDNAVVVFEHVNPGLPLARQARIEHVRRHLPHVLVPVFGSTLTTVGIFIPLLFAMEEVRMFLMPLGMALTLTLLASVLISLTWIPYALIWLVRIPHAQSPSTHTHRSKLAGRLRFFARPQPPSSRKKRFRWTRISLGFFAWRHRLRWLIYPAMVLLIGVPLYLIPEPEPADEDEPGRLYEWSRYYFDNDDVINRYIGGIGYRFHRGVRFGEGWAGWPVYDHVTVTVRPPIGTPFEEIDKIIRQFETLAGSFEHAITYYESHINEQGAFGRVEIYFREEYLNRADPFRLYGQAAYLAARTGNTRISVSGFGESFGTGYGGGMMQHRITLTGFSYDQLEASAEELRRRLLRHRRVQEVDINQAMMFWRDDLYQYVLRPDDDRMTTRGLSRPAVLHAVQLDINREHSPYGRIEFGGTQMYLIARNLRDREYMEDFLHVPRRMGSTVFTVADIGELTRERTLPQIRREDQMYTRIVAFDFLGPSRLGQSVAEEVVETFPVPPGMSVTTGFRGWFGAEEDRSLLLIFLMAMLSVWMIISALLERWRDPLVILLAIPLGGIGIMAGALYHDLQFDRSAMAGALLVMGVVVNN